MLSALGSISPSAEAWSRPRSASARSRQGSRTHSCLATRRRDRPISRSAATRSRRPRSATEPRGRRDSGPCSAPRRSRPARTPSRSACRPRIRQRSATRCGALDLSLDSAVKHALLRIGAVGLASVVTALVLFGVGRLILVGDLGVALPSFSKPSLSPSPSPSPSVSPAVLSDIATPNPSPAAAPTPAGSPTERAAPTEAPIALTSFRFGGRSYVGIVVPEVGRTFAAPFAGTVEVLVYQFIDGEVRVGSNVPTLPFYPYVSLVAADPTITYRPEMLRSV